MLSGPVHVVPRHRECVGPCLDGQDLINGHPVVGETVGAAGKIDPPDTPAPFPGDRLDPISGCLEALRPMGERDRVMAAQVLEVYRLQPGRRHLFQGEPDMGELSVREDVALHKGTAAERRLGGVRIGRCDAVVEGRSVVGKQSFETS